MRRAVVSFGMAAVAGIVFWFFPLFHIVRNEHGPDTKGESTFNAIEYANTFWSTQLVPVLKEAPDATAVLAALQENSEAAREKFGRRVGVSRTRLFAVRGSGKIVSVDKQGIGVALTDKSNEPGIVLKTGLIFGNTVRDATGSLNAGGFSDSRQLNEISAELNRIAETRVVQKLRDAAKVGRQVEFAGCAEIADDSSDVRPLAIIPLDVRVE